MLGARRSFSRSRRIPQLVEVPGDPLPDLPREGLCLHQRHEVLGRRLALQVQALFRGDELVLPVRAEHLAIEIVGIRRVEERAAGLGEGLHRALAADGGLQRAHQLGAQEIEQLRALSGAQVAPHLGGLDGGPAIELVGFGDDPCPGLEDALRVRLEEGELHQLCWRDEAAAAEDGLEQVDRGEAACADRQGEPLRVGERGGDVLGEPFRRQGAEIQCTRLQGPLRAEALEPVHQRQLASIPKAGAEGVGVGLCEAAQGPGRTQQCLEPREDLRPVRPLLREE